MKKTVLGLNFLFMTLSLVSVIKGVSSSLLFALFYGMSIGSLASNQKNVFHYITFAINIFLLIGGIVTLGYLLVANTYFSNGTEKVFWMVTLFFSLIVIPLFNLLFIKTKIK